MPRRSGVSGIACCGRPCARRPRTFMLVESRPRSGFDAAARARVRRRPRRVHSDRRSRHAWAGAWPGRLPKPRWLHARRPRVLTSCLRKTCLSVRKYSSLGRVARREACVAIRVIRGKDICPLAFLHCTRSLAPVSVPNISQLSGARALRSQQIPAFSRAPRAHSQKQKTRPGPAWLKVSSRARPSSAARIRLFRRRTPAPLSKR